MPRHRRVLLSICLMLPAACGLAIAKYTNFEVSQVHPVALTPSGTYLLVLNTPDARLDILRINSEGVPIPETSIPVGLEPVSVVLRSETEAWVVNHLSDSISIVDLASKTVVRTLPVGDEPTDVAFARGRAFVSISQEDRIDVYELADLGLPPTQIDLSGSDPRALAVSADGSTVYAVVLESGNQTSVVQSSTIFGNDSGLEPTKLAALGLEDINCAGPPPPYPPLPAGIVRNPALTDPPSGVPPVALILHYNEAAQRWEDEAGQDWSHCLRFRLPDHDLFAIDTSTLDVTATSGLGTTLFDVSVQPGTGKIWVPNTDARNFVRFEHPFGVAGHVVDNEISIVDPAQGNSVTRIDLNQHVDRASDPTTNIAERLASVSQPGMMAWSGDGSIAYLTAIGSRKVFRVSGSCAAGDCIFGPDRSRPQAVEVGGGPTGVALDETHDRLYVLNRFDNSISIVEASSLTNLGTIALHDPSSTVTRKGRPLLYDGISTSGHGDASCASCHISADRDGLAWDLGNPEGELVPYGTAGDNVRFVRKAPSGPNTEDCPPAECADHAGFDPQKGPMTTQTLRAMIEPVHWRGDRSTVNAFNGAFVSLLGKEDIGPINGGPAGLSVQEMEGLRQFLLEIRFPPNPYRNLDDTLPNADVALPGHVFSGNPTAGRTVYMTGITDGNASCVSCHQMPFGTNGGKLGGIGPGDPPNPNWSALHRGLPVASAHSDMKIPHLRNMYEKPGPRFGAPGGALPQSKNGFGYAHDGAVPDLGTFFSGNQFQMSPAEIRDVVAFVMHFPTGTRPSVGRQVTVPQGTPPTGTPEQEALLTQLIALGDLADAGRHCELTAQAPGAGRVRAYHLSSGVWVTDLAADAPLATTDLREGAAGPITFTCAPLDNGLRLGGDRDEDGVLDGDDCAPGDPLTSAAPPLVEGVSVVRESGGARVSWTEVSSSPQSAATLYDIMGGSLAQLRTIGWNASDCLAGQLPLTSYVDPRPRPSAGDGEFYLVRAENECRGSFGPGREELDAQSCVPLSF